MDRFWSPSHRCNCPYTIVVLDVFESNLVACKVIDYVVTTVWLEDLPVFHSSFSC